MQAKLLLATFLLLVLVPALALASSSHDPYDLVTDNRPYNPEESKLAYKGLVLVVVAGGCLILGRLRDKAGDMNA